VSLARTASADQTATEARSAAAPRGFGIGSSRTLSAEADIHNRYHGARAGEGRSRLLSASLRISQANLKI
jgi:hypothetical protein